jgi:peptidoglycan/LPS O-acetylase OafA/YrhL
VRNDGECQHSDVFFAISGNLVLMSYENPRSALGYFEKRARRILPGYRTVVVASAQVC